MVHVPVGSAATAMSRWLSPVNAPVSGTTSRVSITRKNVPVAGSYRQDGSVATGLRRAGEGGTGGPGGGLRAVAQALAAVGTGGVVAARGGRGVLVGLRPEGLRNLGGYRGRIAAADRGRLVRGRAGPLDMAGGDCRRLGRRRRAGAADERQ